MSTKVLKSDVFRLLIIFLQPTVEKPELFTLCHKRQRNAQNPSVEETGTSKIWNISDKKMIEMK